MSSTLVAFSGPEGLKPSPWPAAALTLPVFPPPEQN